MSILGPVTQADEHRWQLIAMSALEEIVAAHPGLQVIEWRVRGSLRLVGDASDDAMAFEAWLGALELTETDAPPDRRLARGELATRRGHHVKVLLRVALPLPKDEAVRP